MLERPEPAYHGQQKTATLGPGPGRLHTNPFPLVFQLPTCHGGFKGHLGGVIILHGEVTIRKMGTPEARRPDRVGAYL